MARKEQISYAGLTVAPTPTPGVAEHKSAEAEAAPTVRARRAGSSMRDQSSPFTLYLHPDGAKALKRYALEQDTKVHSLLLDAIEDWFRRKGLRETVRVAAGPPRQPE